MIQTAAPETGRTGRRSAVRNLSWTLAVANATSGAIKVIAPEMATTRLPWARRVPPIAVRAIGAVEVAGGLGLVLPWSTGITPALTPAAAQGLTVFQTMAVAVHLRRREYLVIPVNLTLALLTQLIAVDRWGNRQDHHRDRGRTTHNH